MNVAQPPEQIHQGSSGSPKVSWGKLLWSQKHVPSHSFVRKKRCDGNTALREKQVSLIMIFLKHVKQSYN